MYRITAINNHTHEVTITHDSGKSDTFIVPYEHRAMDLKKAYIHNRAMILDSTVSKSAALSPSIVDSAASTPTIPAKPLTIPWYIKVLRWLRII